MLFSTINTVCSLLILLQALGVLNRMDEKTPNFATLQWFVLGVGSFSNLIAPPPILTWGFIAILLVCTWRIIQPTVFYMVYHYDNRRLY